MSYILDALRRADSERERERSAVPGLHTQAVPAGAPDADSDTRPNPWKWPIVAGFVALSGMVAWLWLDRADTPQAVVAAAPPPAPAVPAAPIAPIAPIAPVAPVAQVPAAPAAASAVTAAAVEASPPAAAPTRKPTPPAPKKAPAPSPVATAREPEPKLPKLAELPEEVRREVPSITVNGSTYSKSAGNRMLIINGQVFREGDALATGLVLEQIRQKSAVLRFRTHRYEITF
jgi:general secretion pathway protein B